MPPTLIITLLAVFAVAIGLAFAVANEALNQVDGVRPGTRPEGQRQAGRVG